MLTAGEQALVARLYKTLQDSTRLQLYKTTFYNTLQDKTLQLYKTLQDSTIVQDTTRLQLYKTLQDYNCTRHYKTTIVQDTTRLQLYKTLQDYNCTRHYKTTIVQDTTRLQLYKTLQDYSCTRHYKTLQDKTLQFYKTLTRLQLYKTTRLYKTTMVQDSTRKHAYYMYTKKSSGLKVSHLLNQPQYRGARTPSRALCQDTERLLILIRFTTLQFESQRPLWVTIDHKNSLKIAETGQRNTQKTRPFPLKRLSVRKSDRSSFHQVPLQLFFGLIGE